jgi:hypothetical protein
MTMGDRIKRGATGATDEVREQTKVQGQNETASERTRKSTGRGDQAAAEVPGTGTRPKGGPGS